MCSNLTQRLGALENLVHTNPESFEHMQQLSFAREAPTVEYVELQESPQRTIEIKGFDEQELGSETEMED